MIGRAFNQTDVGQKTASVFSDFCRQIALMEKRKQPPRLRAGNPRVIRDFLHVWGAVRAYYLLACRGKKGEIYNVGSGKGLFFWRRPLIFLKKKAIFPSKSLLFLQSFGAMIFPVLWRTCRNSVAWVGLHWSLFGRL